MRIIKKRFYVIKAEINAKYKSKRTKEIKKNYTK